MDDNGLIRTPSGVTFRVIRLQFSKTGRAKFISHLDLNRTMTRALRRAGLPIWYTEGFNKHPYLTFASPLSLGYEGLAEYMDIRLVEDVPMEEVLARLNATMPEGLCFTNAAEAVKKPADLASAAWRITVGCSAEDVRAFLEQPSITVEKRTKKKTMKTVELKPLLGAVQAEGADDGTVLTLTLPCSNTETVNPSLMLTAFETFLSRPLKTAVLRLCLLDTEGKIYR